MRSSPEQTIEIDRADDGQHLIVRLMVGTELVASHEPLADRLSEAIFDAQRAVENAARGVSAEEVLDEIAARVGTDVLGPTITEKVTAAENGRTIVLRLSSGLDAGPVRLAALLARVPWEIARAAKDGRSLLDRNVTVRLDLSVPRDSLSPPIPLPSDPDDYLRVLLVFAEAPGLRPLSARKEREALLDLFYEKVMQDRRVKVDVLCHGVTRARLKYNIAQAQGYHIVHWSGHGEHDALELEGEDGRRDRLRGTDLKELFQGYFPQMVFVNSCRFGSIAGVRDAAALQAMFLDSGVTPAPPEGASSASAVGPTALLRAGVPNVVAQRFATFDHYALDLATHFYDHLLSSASACSVETALRFARARLREGPVEKAYSGVDHLAPVLFGARPLVIDPPRGKSEHLSGRNPRLPMALQDVPNLERPAFFIGRGRELSRLRNEWLSSERTKVAIIQGAGGLGKSLLAAETIHMWHSSFEHVFAFQGKLSVEEFFKRIHERLRVQSSHYSHLCNKKSDRHRRIHLPPSENTAGSRYFALCTNLINALTNDRVLLVLDSFHENLQDPGNEGSWLSMDPEWDLLLTSLCRGLPQSHGSCALLTTRAPIAALQKGGVVSIQLSPLDKTEAILFAESSPVLYGMLQEPEHRELMLQALDACKGHPLTLALLESVAKLSKEADDWPSKIREWIIQQSKVTISRSDGRDRERETRPARMTIDELVKQVDPSARLLLWALSLAGEPVPSVLLSQGTFVSNPGPSLDRLAELGLIQISGDAGDRSYQLQHGLVGERVRAHMAAPENANDRGPWSEQAMLLAYGEFYHRRFRELSSSSAPGHAEDAARARRRVLAYFLSAGAFREITLFAVPLVAKDSTLGQLIDDELHEMSGREQPGERRRERVAWVEQALRVARRVSTDVGKYVGKYRLGRLLGVGGMSAVYEASCTMPKGVFAVKIFEPGVAGEHQQDDAANLVDHEGAVGIIDSGTAELDGERIAFVAMKMIRGQTLAQLREDDPTRFTADAVLDVAAKILEVLSAAHRSEAMVVHRDIKPSNVMINEEGRVKVLDFGISQMSSREVRGAGPGGVVGSRGFMAPEQLRGEAAGPCTDIWAVGATMHWLLSGRGVEGSLDRGNLRGVPEGVVAVIARALRDDPNERWHSAEEMSVACAKVYKALTRRSLRVTDIVSDTLLPSSGRRNVVLPEGGITELAPSHTEEIPRRPRGVPPTVKMDPRAPPAPRDEPAPRADLGLPSRWALERRPPERPIWPLVAKMTGVAAAGLLVYAAVTELPPLLGPLFRSVLTISTSTPPLCDSSEKPTCRRGVECKDGRWTSSSEPKSVGTPCGQADSGRMVCDSEGNCKECISGSKYLSCEKAKYECKSDHCVIRERGCASPRRIPAAKKTELGATDYANNDGTELCGGPKCAPCTNDHACNAATDCESGYCNGAGTCARR